MIEMEIRVKILPHKRIEFIQAMKTVCESHADTQTASPFNIYQDLNDDNLFYCLGQWDSRKLMETYQKTISFEMLIGAIQVLGEIQHAQIHDISTTDEMRIS